MSLCLSFLKLAELTTSPRFLGLVFRITFYVLYRAYRFLSYYLWRLARTAGIGGDNETLRETWATSGAGVDAEEAEDEDWTPGSEAESEASGTGSEESGEDSDEEPDDFDPSTLYCDLASQDEPPDTSLVLAHHLSPSPLTRRRYSALAASNSGQAFSSAVEHRRMELRRSAEDRGPSDGWEAQRRLELDEGRQRFCVVCTVEERSIICWPCRAFFRSWSIRALTALEQAASRFATTAEGTWPSAPPLRNTSVRRAGRQ